MIDERPRRIVIGLGNPDRGDDAAGRVVARRLRGRLPPDLAILEHDGEATSLLAWLEGAETVYLVDACASGAPAGTLHRFDASAGPLPQDAFDLSTHGMGLAAAIELARALDQLPARCIVYAIEAGSFGLAQGLSPAVAAAIQALCGRLQGELGDGDGAGLSSHA